CTARSQIVARGDECAALREVSGPGAPPLRVTKAAGGDDVRHESLPGVPYYNLHVGSVGSWISQAGAPARECFYSDFTNHGDGTLSVLRALPVNVWLVVTASNDLGEGPAGMRSD